MRPPRAATSGTASERIVLFGLFGIGNLGNDATLLATLRQIRQRLPDADLACVCEQAPAFSSAVRITTLPLEPLVLHGRWRIPGPKLRETYVALGSLLTEPWRRRRLRRLIGPARRLIVVGTGILDDYGEWPWANPATLLRWCRVARQAGAQVEFLAVGAGPITNRANRFMLLRALRTAQGRSYRDERSQRFLAGLGVPTSSDTVLPDLAFSLPTEIITAARPPTSPPRTIGVGLMGYYGWRNDHVRGREKHERYIATMARFISGLLADGFEVRLLIGELRTDELAVAAVRSQVAAAVPAEALARLHTPSIQSVEDLVAEIAGCDVVVASRFHNLVHALATGRPVIAIGYSQKFDGLLRDMGLEAHLLNIDDFDAQQLRRKFDVLVDRHRELVGQIAARTRVYRQRLSLEFDRLFGASR